MTSHPSHHPRRFLAALALVATALALAACGGGEPLTAPADTGSGETEPVVAAPASQAGTTVNVTKNASPLGDILVGDDGLTLYGFTNDLDGRSVCNGTCAEAWPPVIVGPDWDVAPDLDAGIFNTVARDDGQLQLVAGKWPLYYFGGDARAGDLNGQGSGDVWFVVGTDGLLIEDQAAQNNNDQKNAETTPTGETGEATSVVGVGSTEFGEVFVDENGLSLYGFLDDADGEPTCFGACADAWPPVLVGGPELPAGLDPEVFSVVAYDDGFQLRAGKWPLYRFAGDAAAGDANGQGSGDVWFLARPDGGLVRPEAPSAPAADRSVGAADSNAGGDTGDSYDY